jgi:cell division protein FtsI (penicillin-binding protein 3)
MASNVALSEPLNNVGKPVLTASDLPRTGGLKSDILKTMQTMQLKHEILPATGTAWANIVPKNDTIFVNPRSVNTKKMVPSVVGLGLMDALYLLENRGLHVQFSGYGKVVSQSLNPGIQILKPETILLKLE